MITVYRVAIAAFLVSLSLGVEACSRIPIAFFPADQVLSRFDTVYLGRVTAIAGDSVETKWMISIAEIIKGPKRELVAVVHPNLGFCVGQPNAPNLNEDAILYEAEGVMFIERVHLASAFVRALRSLGTAQSNRRIDTDR